METEKLFAAQEFTTVCRGAQGEVQSVYCADLLSWAMARAPAGCAWCTVMGNVNAIAVATLTEAAAIVLCEGAVYDSEALKRAQEKGIFLVTTDLPAFEAGLLLAKRGGLHGFSAGKS